LKRASFRTAYLDKSVAEAINSIMNEEVHNATGIMEQKKINFIVMGGGYDTRSIKLLERSLLQNTDIPHYELLKQKRQQRTRWWNRMRRKLKEPSLNNAFDNITSKDYDLECFELDLPEVVRAKTQLLQTRLFKRRPWLQDIQSDYPKLIPVDFNNLNDTRSALESIVLSEDAGNTNVHNIIIFEGVMIYLDEGVPHALLDICSSILNKRKSQSSSYLCFADRLENIPGGDEDAAHIEMDSTGWELIDWLPKPGLARHMGVARLR